MRKKLIGVFLILLAALILLQGYFVKWDISIWTLAWVTLLAVLSLSSFLEAPFWLGLYLWTVSPLLSQWAIPFSSGVQFGGYPFFNPSSDRSQYFIQPL